MPKSNSVLTVSRTCHALVSSLGHPLLRYLGCSWLWRPIPARGANLMVSCDVPGKNRRHQKGGEAVWHIHTPMVLNCQPIIPFFSRPSFTVLPRSSTVGFLMGANQNSLKRAN